MSGQLSLYLANTLPRRQNVLLLATDPLPLGKQVEGGSIALSLHKASKIIGCRKSPSTLFWCLTGGGDGRRKANTPEVRMAAGGNAGPKRPVSLAWGKEGIG